MESGADITLWLAFAFAGLALLLSVAKVYLWARGRAQARQLQRRAARAHEIVRRHLRQEHPQSVPLVEELRGLADPVAVEMALHAWLEPAEAAERARLVEVFQTLGFTARYLERLGGAGTWSERAQAAYAVGRLRVLEAIPLLARLLSDTSDGARSVRVAASQALAELATTEAVPLLLAELDAADEAARPVLLGALESAGAETIPDLVEVLETGGSPSLRLWAVRVLGRMRQPGISEVLLDRLTDRAPEVRQAVVEALVGIGDGEAVKPALHAALRDPVESVRAAAAVALASLPEAQVLPGLIAGLADPDYLIRLRALEAVERVGPRDVSAVTARLRDPSPEVKRRAAAVLAHIASLDEVVSALGAGTKEVVEQAREILLELAKAGQIDPLLKQLTHPDSLARARLAELLGISGERRAAQALLGSLADADSGVVLAAIEALTRLQSPAATTRLIPLLAAADDAVQAAASKALRTLGVADDESTRAALADLFRRGGPTARAAAVELLGEQQTPEVEGILETGLSDPDAEVRLQATRAVAQRASDRWFDALLARLDDPSTPVRATAASGLGRLGTASAFTWLYRHLDTPDPEFREALSEALAAYGPRTLATLVTRSKTLERRLALVWALGKTSNPDSIPPLIELGRDESPAVRAAVAGALGRHRDAAAAEDVLLGLLGDRNERVRAAAVNALGRRKDADRAIPRLIEALADPDAFVRNRGALAVGRLGGDLALESLTWAIGQAVDPDEVCHLVIGLVATGSQAGLALAVSRMKNANLEARVKAMLEREDDALRATFRRNVRLEQQDTPGTGLTAGDLVSNYVMALVSSQWISARTSAISALRALGIAPFKPLLFDAVRSDPAPEVRVLAIEALADLRDDTAVADLCAEALRDRDVDVRTAALTALAPIREQTHFSAALACLLLNSPDLERSVVETLVATASEDVPALLDALAEQTDERIIRGAAAVLRAIADQRSSAVLRVWIAHPNEEVRAEAVRTLGVLDTAEARRLLLSALTDASRLVRMTVLDAIPHLKDPEVLAAVKDRAEDPAAPVRIALARLAGRGPYPTGVEITERLCWDADQRVRVEALTTLLFVRQREALDRFALILRRQPENVLSALRKAGSVRLAAAALQTLVIKKKAAPLRVAALRAMGAVGQASRELILGALSDPVLDVVLAAVEVVGDTADAELREAVDRLLDHEDPEVRKAVRSQRLRLVEPKQPTPSGGFEVLKLPQKSRSSDRR